MVAAAKLSAQASACLRTKLWGLVLGVVMNGCHKWESMSCMSCQNGTNWPPEMTDAKASWDTRVEMLITG